LRNLVRRPRFTYAHFDMLLPFIICSSYVWYKMFEAFRPSALSETDKKNSQTLKDLKARGVYWSWYPEYTAPPPGERRKEEEHHH